MENTETYKKGRGLLERCGAIEITTSHALWDVIDFEEVLLPCQGDGYNIKNGVLFEISEDTEDGTFPRVSDYVRYANAIENEGTQYFLNRYRRKKERLDIQWDGVRVIRESEYTNKAKLIFDNPIEIVIVEKCGQNITMEITTIKGEFTHDWVWRSNGRQDKIANGVEIWFNIEELLDSETWISYR